MLLSTVQMVALLPLLNLPFPTNFRRFCLRLKSTNADFDALPNWYAPLAVDETKLDTRPYNVNFQLLSISTNYFILNSGRILIIWSLLPLAVIVVTLL